jgi:hypothetical protein
VTENGVADERDAIRGPYIIEHLLAVAAAIEVRAHRHHTSLYTSLGEYGVGGVAHARHARQHRHAPGRAEGGFTYLHTSLRPSDHAQAGAPVVGYVFWTISDNWEWADGYCPKVRY